MQRTDSGRQLFESELGLEFLLRTNQRGILILEAEAPTSTSRLLIEAVPNLVFAMPGATYLIPTTLLGEDARMQHRVWLRYSETSGRSRTWQMMFDNRMAIWHGYAVWYRRFQLD